MSAFIMRQLWMARAFCVWRLAVFYCGADPTSQALFISGNVILKGDYPILKKLSKIVAF
jgi:hypothetical protein